MFCSLIFMVGCGDDDETNPAGSGGQGDQNSAITINAVHGLVNSKIPTNSTVIFDIRLANSTGDYIAGLANGFRI